MTSIDYNHELSKLPLCPTCGDTQYVTEEVDTTKLYDITHYTCTECDIEWKAPLAQHHYEI